MEEPPVNKSDTYKSPSLRRWRVFEITLQGGARSRHIVGHDVSNDAARVSSVINAFDRKTMTATSRSGNRYLLLGTPGWGRKVEKVWRDWCSQNKVVSEEDVTHEYFDVDNFFHHPEKDDED